MIRSENLEALQDDDRSCLARCRSNLEQGLLGALGNAGSRAVNPVGFEGTSARYALARYSKRSECKALTIGRLMLRLFAWNVESLT